MKLITNPATTLLPLDDDQQYDRLCAALTQSRTLEDLTARTHRWAQYFGFTAFLFVRLERCWQADIQKGLLCSFSPLWLQCYLDSKLYNDDLLLAYGKINTQPVFSSQLYGYIDRAPFDLPLTHDNRRVFQLYQRFDYFDHYAVPLPAYNGHGHVLLLLTCAGSEPQEFQASVAPVMAASRNLCRAIDAISTQQFNTAFIQRCDQPAVMTHSQLKILRCLANEDYSITELAKQLCVSPITAHQHIAAVRKALHTRTNIRAVMKAIKAGLITLQ